MIFIDQFYCVCRTRLVFLKQKEVDVKVVSYFILHVSSSFLLANTTFLCIVENNGLIRWIQFFLLENISNRFWKILFLVSLLFVVQEKSDFSLYHRVYFLSITTKHKNTLEIADSILLSSLVLSSTYLFVNCFVEYNKLHDKVHPSSYGVSVLLSKIERGFWFGVSVSLLYCAYGITYDVIIKAFFK